MMTMIKNLHYLLILLFSAFYYYPSSSQDLLINEILPSNRFILEDEDRDYPDWFEIINNSKATLNLKNYSLSDDRNAIHRWTFPDYTMESGEILLVFASGKNRYAPPMFFNTIIDEGDIWKYHIPKEEVPSWTNPDFVDSEWKEGPSGFGYSDNDDATLLHQTVSVYLRKEFYINDTSDIGELILHIDYDDGFVAYLNGNEVARSNMGPAGNPPAFDATAEELHEASMYRGGSPEKFSLDENKHLLLPGRNIIAIEVHNKSYGSSDFTAIPFLTISEPEKPISIPPSFLPELAAGFHTNFKLDADGDSLYLFDPLGNEVHNIIIKSLPPDISLGYKPGDYSELFGFGQPTPWEENTGEALFYRDSDPPVFSLPGGAYKYGIFLTISNNDPNDSIFYTTDGSEPTRHDNYYEGKFLIDKTTTLRAKAFQSGKIPGETMTRSYVIGKESELPIVLISTDPENLFDDESGIYVKGENAEDEHPYFGANFWEDWEKPAHVEYYNQSDNQSFSIDAGIKIYGNYSRGHPQKSISIFARSKYGDKSINARLFENSPLDKFEAIVLRNSGNEWVGEGHQSGVMFRDLFMTSVARSVDVDAQAGRPVIVYINGKYWGIHNMREKINEHFIADNHNYEPEQINLLEGNARIIQGSSKHYIELRKFLRNNDITRDENYEQLKTMMDIDEFIHYCVLQIHYFNGDWPGNNIKFWRPSVKNGKWRWIMFDTDFGYGLWNNDEKINHKTMDFATTTEGENWPNPPWSTFLLRTLLKNEEFKFRFINTFADLLNTSLLPDSMIARLTIHKEEISSEMHSHIERWGGNHDRWLDNIEKMKKFAKLRPWVSRIDLMEFFNIYNSVNLDIDIKGCEDAAVLLNTIKLKSFPWSGKYFEKIPVQITAVPPEGYRFARWEGDFEADTAHVELKMIIDQSITAIFEPVETGKEILPVINEIFYKSTVSVNSGDWVELFNPADDFIDLSGWNIRDNDNDNNFLFNEETIMEPGGYLVICNDMISFTNVHPEVKNITGNMDFGLSSDGDCIRLYNTSGDLIDSVCYSPEYPWPGEPDGMGYSLSLRDPNLDNSLANNWFTSKELFGSPGNKNNTNLTGSEQQHPVSKLNFNVYPNPFKERIYLDIHLPEPSTISIEIFDLNGRRIKFICEERRLAGSQRFEWTPSDSSPGIYILKIKSEDSIDYRKVIYN